MGTPQHVAAGNKTLSSVTKPIQPSFFFSFIYMTLKCRPSQRNSRATNCPRTVNETQDISWSGTAPNIYSVRTFAEVLRGFSAPPDIPELLPWVRFLRRHFQFFIHYYAIIRRYISLSSLQCPCCLKILEVRNKLRGFRPQSELYPPSDRSLSAKLVSTLADRGCRVVSATNPHGR
jgi:hypothetical protein